MNRPAVDFLLYLLRCRQAQTVTPAEGRLLSALAAGRHSVVEVGVHEGATSARLAAAMAPAGRLWLIDHYPCRTRLERLAGFSFAEHVARRSLRPWADRVRFVRRSSTAAARELTLESPADLIFIDADHAYGAVHEDFLAWTPHLDLGGNIAFHDSRHCAARPELDSTTGSVQLVDEILRGEHGAWSLVGEADSVAAFSRPVVPVSRRGEPAQ